MTTVLIFSRRPYAGGLCDMGLAGQSAGLEEHHTTASQLARLVVGGLPGAGQEFIVAAWRALRDELPFVARLSNKPH